MGDHEAMLGDTKGLENTDVRAGTVNYENQLTKTERQKEEREANAEGFCQRLKTISHRGREAEIPLAMVCNPSQ